MKKPLYATFSILLLCSLVVLCCLATFGSGNLAYAETQDDYGACVKLNPATDIWGDVVGVSFNVGGKNVYLYPRVGPDGKPYGVQFAGYYFGRSGITVVAEVYSTDNLVIDFDVKSYKADLTEAQLANRDKLIELFTQISLMIDEVDSYANTTYDGSGEGANKLPVSDVYRYNMAQQGDRIKISYHTYQMLNLAREMYEDTDGAFNPAVYRLVDLWGFSSRIYTYENYGESYDRHWTDNGYPLPDEQYIDAFSNPNFTNFSQEAVKLEEIDGEYYVTKNVAPATVYGESFQQWIDLGGVAKGYVVDLARQMISSYNDYGIDLFYVNAGSSSIAMGWEYDGGKTTLPLQNSFDPYSNDNALLQVELGKTSISTSGQYIRNYSVDGVEYAHIIDGATGAPAQTGVKSVFVVVPEELGEWWATKGDCLTTALTVMGRDKIVNFVNGYLKEKDIKIIVQYQTLDGRKQLLTNFSEDEVTVLSSAFSQFGWALKLGEDGNFYYDADAKFANPTNDSYKTWLIVIGVVLGVAGVALIVYHFVRGKKRTATNVQNAKKDKPFKLLDIMVYVAVVLVILVLFYVFLFNSEDTPMQIINVIDEETGETLYIYNVTRGEGYENTHNINGWTIEVKDVSGGVTVTFTREIDGEMHFNTMQITRGRNASVKMIDSTCGRSQDCVRNFPEVTNTGGVIVCSPNHLKIITE